MIDLQPFRLLRRHIHRRAGHGARLRHAGVIDGAGQTEVGDLDAFDAVLQKDVRRLDVAVHVAVLVGGRQALGCLQSNPQDLLDWQRPLFVELILQRDAVDDLHHEKRRLGFIFDGMNRDHMLVLDGGCGSRFANESCPCRADRSVAWREHLDGDGAVQFFVKRPEHRPEAAFADHFPDLIMSQPAK